MASKPKTMQEAIEMATELMDRRINTLAERQTENKRKFEDAPRNNQKQQQTQGRTQARALYACGNGDRNNRMKGINASKSPRLCTGEFAGQNPGLNVVMGLPLQTVDFTSILVPGAHPVAGHLIDGPIRNERIGVTQNYKSLSDKGLI
ncbi:hypothetical protein Tco_0657429 [Tanacetum coccineum]|uniref:Reverse transcriptase domain-containing protein n=1 Tax=Tanacetum coccineum TaxID=301880 RepID=A0ABQ4XC83_9ASTR